MKESVVDMGNGWKRSFLLDKLDPGNGEEGVQNEDMGA